MKHVLSVLTSSRGQEESICAVVLRTSILSACVLGLSPMEWMVARLQRVCWHAHSGSAFSETVLLTELDFKSGSPSSLNDSSSKCVKYTEQNYTTTIIHTWTKTQKTLKCVFGTESTQYKQEKRADWPVRATSNTYTGKSFIILIGFKIYNPRLLWTNSALLVSLNHHSYHTTLTISEM